MPLRFSPARGAASFALSTAIRGPTGATGTAATIAAGTTTTGNAGSSAAVSNSGSTSAATFDFTIPRGADAGMRYSFESSTTMAAPASGGLRLDNATIASVANIAINATNSDSVDVSDWIATWDDSTNTTKGYVQLRKEGSGSVLALFRVTSVTDNTTWLQIAVTYVSGSGSLSASDRVYLTPYRSGDTGASTGILQAYSSTTTDADPGAGIFRLNNATPASATAAYLDNVDTGGSTVSTIFDLWDDSTNTTKGYLYFEKYGTPTIWAYFAVTGSVVDGTGYRKLTLSSGSGSGAFTNGDTFSIKFFATGDKGIDGSVAGPGASVDSEIALWNGTGGTTLKRASSTGVATVTSGVLGVAGTGTTATFGTIELGAASDTTLSRSSAGVLAVEGVTVPLNSTSSVHTASTIELGHATDTTLSRSSAGVLAVEGVTVSLNSTSATHTASTIELGAATDTTLSRSAAGVLAVEGVNLTPNIPITSKSVAYTVVLADANTAIYHPSSDNNARTFTIDSNANVAYPTGTCLTFINEINTVTIAITTDTLTLAGAGSTGSRTLAANGMATAVKVASTKWVISGTGIT